MSNEYPLSFALINDYAFPGPTGLHKFPTQVILARLWKPSHTFEKILLMFAGGKLDFDNFPFCRFCINGRKTILEI